MDDGCDLVTILHTKRQESLAGVIGGTRSPPRASSGCMRWRRKACCAIRDRHHDALTKHLFDNRYGTGQSTLDGVIRATNVLLGGAQPGGCRLRLVRRGVAMRARGMGANVIVTEIDPPRRSKP